MASSDAGPFFVEIVLAGEGIADSANVLVRCFLLLHFYVFLILLYHLLWLLPLHSLVIGPV
jgi:hypothetical protein